VPGLLINVARVGVKVRVGLEQGYTTQISWRAKKILLKYSRARLVKFFFPIFIVFPSEIKPNIRKFGLCGPDCKLSRATFGPRAVCCACLV